MLSANFVIFNDWYMVSSKFGFALWGTYFELSSDVMYTVDINGRNKMKIMTIIY
jgi:hypothetical protein